MWNSRKTYKTKSLPTCGGLDILMLRIEKLWGRLIRKEANGNAVNVKNSASDPIFTEIMYYPWLKSIEDSSTGTHTSNDYSSEPSNPFVNRVTVQSQPPKMPSADKLKIGDKVLYTGKADDARFYNKVGTIEDIPNSNIAWVS